MDMFVDVVVDESALGFLRHMHEFYTITSGTEAGYEYPAKITLLHTIFT